MFFKKFIIFKALNTVAYFHRASLPMSSTPQEAAPLWLLIGAQAIASAGDCIAQRCSRIYHRGSKRRMYLSISAVNLVQVKTFCTI